MRRVSEIVYEVTIGECFYGTMKGEFVRFQRLFGIAAIGKLVHIFAGCLGLFVLA